MSHAAPARHFGDKTGLLTAVATEGYQLLAEAVSAACRHSGSFLEAGVAYVQFAITHRAHFAVMFRPDLYRADDPVLARAQTQARTALRGPAAATASAVGDDAGTAALAGCSLLHGLATLWLAGNIDDPDPQALARVVGRFLFRGPAPGAEADPDYR